jgi:hypothetical protein
MRAAHVGLILLSLSMTACPGIGKLLRGYGYTELRPPSNLLAPGAMVWVRNSDPFTAGVICTQRAAMGNTFVPMASSTASSALTQSSKHDFNLDATYLNYLKGEAKYADVSSLTVRLDNATIFEVNDVDILNHVSNRDPACSAAIKLRADAGFYITMISSALQADVTYTVNWNRTSSLDASAKIAVVQNLAVELGLGGAHVSDNTIQAKGLYWGIMDDAFLAHLSEPAAVTPVDKGSRMIAAQITPHLELAPDVE